MKNPERKLKRVRGNGWNTYHRGNWYNWYFPKYRYSDVGFRIVLSRNWD